MRCDRPVVFLLGDLRWEEGKTKNEERRRKNVVFRVGELFCEVSAEPFWDLVSGLIPLI